MKIAVVLSGCGVFDGAEIHESVLTLWSLEQNKVDYDCLAPNVQQAHVINHMTGEEMAESRNVLVEAARISRGAIIDVAKASADDYDALIFPGGFGAAKNLSDFAFKGADCCINPDVLAFAQKFASANKPMGFICIAPAMIPKIFNETIDLTIGSDKETAKAINQMGGHHVECPVTEMVVDEQHKVVSTPAYMLAENISQAASGISKLVKEVIRLAK